MARFNVEDSKHYGEDNGSFFSLANDGDSAIVRFVYGNAGEFSGNSVHEVTINGSKRYVDCLRSYSDPLDNCPFCKASIKLVAKYFIKLFNEDADESQCWDRSRKFGDRVSGILAEHQNILACRFKITRDGVANDPNTKYEIEYVDEDETTFEDIPEPVEVEGKVILIKTAEEMLYYIENGIFPSTEEESSNEKSKRNPAKDSGARRPAAQQRRTPANTGLPGKTSTPGSKRATPAQKNKNQGTETF